MLYVDTGRQPIPRYSTASRPYFIEPQLTGDAERQETAHESAGPAAANDEARQQDVRAVRRRVPLPQRPHAAAEPRPPGEPGRHGRRCEDHSRRRRRRLGRGRVERRHRDPGSRRRGPVIATGRRVRRRSVVVARRRRSWRWIEVLRWIPTGAF